MGTKPNDAPIVVVALATFVTDADRRAGLVERTEPAVYVTWTETAISIELPDPLGSERMPVPGGQGRPGGGHHRHGRTTIPAGFRRASADGGHRGGRRSSAGTAESRVGPGLFAADPRAWTPTCRICATSHRPVGSAPSSSRATSAPPTSTATDGWTCSSGPRPGRRVPG